MIEAIERMQTSLRSQHVINRHHVHAELVQRIAENADKTAFTELFEHYGPKLKGFMMGKGANPDLAEDLVQDTMMQVWRKASLYASSKGSVSTWIFTIARNLRIDAFRRTRGVRYEDISDFDFESDGPSSDDSVNDDQESAIVAKAVGTLPSDQRQVIQLAYSEDLTHVEIAERLKQPLGTVKSRIRIAYQKLNTMLEDLR